MVFIATVNNILVSLLVEETGVPLYVFFLPKQGTLSCVLYNLEASAIVMICALWAVIVMIVLLLDLQLPMQSVPILTKVVSSNTAHGEVYSLQHYVIKFVSDLWQVVVYMHKQNFSIDMIYIIKCLDMWYMYIVSLVTIYKRHNIYEKKNFCQMSF
jgi:hypothetical protein